MNNGQEKIKKFLAAPSFAVIGASDNPDKFGYKVYKTYLKHKLKAYPINPRVKAIDGNPTYESLTTLPEKVKSISVITPPAVTEQVVDDAIAYGITDIWMQPGAESPQAISKAESAGISVIHGGPCILIELG